ncbi:MAG TPA: sigma 54-interacting transcriptional regulator [Vicinamibacterales bacterium]|nr:sigma 54-interacting transcriptional regulator [Vicinamibacterales bacterium]
MPARRPNPQPAADPNAAAVKLPRPHNRGRDRRVALHDFLAYLAGALNPGRDPRELRVRFEDGLRRLVPVRALALRHGAIDAPARSNGVERLALPLPGPPASATVLDAALDPGCPLDAWDAQLLQLARYIGALVMEIERARQVDTTPRPRADDSLLLIGSGTAVRKLRERIARVAATDFTILIEGESGVGKELVARHIHVLSRRARGPFIAVNCAALVESLLEAELFGIEERTATGVRGRRGKFELADQGTMFLDEVSDLTPSAQAKLLRAIQDLSVERVGGHSTRRIDTRIVVATNRSLLELVEKGRFRADLYYRLNGVEIRVAPLRDRREDIPELAMHFLDRHRLVRQLKLSAGALDALIAYDWPGNVRELERVMERAIALARTSEIRLDDLPSLIARGYAEALMPSIDRNETLRAWGSRYARLVLERHNNNKRQACRALGISYHTLRSYLNYRPRGSLFAAEGPAEEEDAPT